MSTKIEWADETWNPAAGCSPVSAGCKNCYAVKSARRQALLRPAAYDRYRPLVHHFWKEDSTRWRWSGKVELFPERLDAPLRWRKPRRVFVCSMSDLFHEAVPDEFVARVYAVMLLAHWHTYQTLTKRTGRQLSLLSDPAFAKMVGEAAFKIDPHGAHLADDDWPLKNVIVGASVEDDKNLWRVPDLLATPAAKVRFLSLEPLLGPVELKFIGSAWKDATLRDLVKIDHVIVGGESGPGARPCNVEWIRSVVQQCKAAGVPCFVKQLGTHPWEDGISDAVILRRYPSHHFGIIRHPKGGDPAEWPEDLRVRELPDA